MARLSCIVMIVSIALTCALANELYSNQYDGIDVANILQNEKLRNQYYSCIMETSPCVTADAKFFKEIFNEAVQTKCKRCNEKQKENMNLIVDWYTKNKPEEWEALMVKTIENITKKSNQ